MLFRSSGDGLEIEKIGIDEDKTPDYSILSHLFSEARRQALNVEKVIHEIKRLLDQPGMIGAE